ncbi:S-layer protein [Deinococcus sp. RL]|uniref:S-layer homology domain-containing protein n=1 Tax=Deinococcus sp. RL TaxID=1489678 RepID=UPI0004DA3642|nr:S-layer homology domain-containing protein [Deinococcus sp. RL]KEF33812.1 S-layer protein [Deinococcus sp. RL]
MKKSLLVLTAALSFGAATAQTTAPATAPQVSTLTDVPAGHWAKDAIDRLVSQGIILGYPDGTYRGTQNLTRYEAAVIIARLLDQIRTGTVTIDNTETLTALQNAIQELAADLTALGVRVSDLEENAVSRDDFTRLEARVEALAAANGDAAAIAAIQAQIEELTARADEYDTLRGDIDDNAAQITALNELTVLLNQDILDLQDRVSAVETAQADFVTRSDFDNLAGRVTAVDQRVTGVANRVTTLENAPRFSVVGGLTSGFGRLNLVSGTDNFDVSRLTARTPVSGILGDADVTTPDTAADYNRSGTITFGIRATNLRTTTGSVVVTSAGLNFGLTTVSGVPNLVQLRDANLAGTINGQAFTVRYNTTANAFKFSDYLFNNTDGLTGPGIVATIEATTLPFRPTITAVTGSSTNAAIGGSSSAAVNYYGVRAAVKPSATSTVGVSYAQGNRTAFGLDYSAQVAGISLKGEGVISALNVPANNFLAGNFQGYLTNGDKAFYTEARANLGIASFGVNYRTVDPDFAVDGTENAGMMVTNSMPYAPNQTGFGAALGTNLGPVALGAYGDTYTPYGGGTRTTGFGVKAGAKLGALELVGFYNNATVGGNAVRSATNLGNAGMGIAGVPRPMTSTFGVQLSHNGSAENALVRNLNFTVGDAYFYSDPLNEFYAYADYSTTVAGITLQPLVRYQLRTDRNIVNNVDESENTVKYGIRLSTATLTELPLQPSLYANAVNRITNTGTAFGVQNGSTTELLGQVGVAFNQFLAPSATARVGYSYYQGYNVASVNVGVADNAFNAASNNIYAGRGGASGKTDGIYAQLGFSGLTANYGLFRYTNLTPNQTTTNQTSVAQGFRVSYNFNF